MGQTGIVIRISSSDCDSLLCENEEKKQPLIQVDPSALTFCSLTVVLTVSLCLFQNRRWSSAQAREFLHLHSTLALITLQADLTPQQTHGETRSRFSSIYWFHSFYVQTFIASLAPCAAPGGFKLQMSGVPSSALLPLHPDILASLFTPDGQPYLQEVTPVVFALLYNQLLGLSSSTLRSCLCDAPAGDVRHA